MMWLPASHFPSQSTAPPTRYTVSIIIDGNPVDLSKGIPAVAHTITMQGQLTPESLRENPQLKLAVSINHAVISLVRDTRRVGFVNWPASKSLTSLSRQSRAGDRYVIQFDDVDAEARDGKREKMTNNVIIQTTVQ